ncbi:hypothetical protein [Bythopirellula polymerisocia]|uniref:Glycerophosphoryl diester phosphodiesterase membrane domain-containing protein n=1 Tax=Bythopirellula polymerisocia TaxID=2528003 RepID=A0A5C6CMC2_9BACT|nr:hypothetical protein [Bythopirellula polymerisocia]TWU25740.1 hypothetical protein Pla144_29520 [Bythopirellula polymerisocia]
MQYEIKSLGLGGILDQTIKLVTNHFGLFFGIVAVLYLPFVLLQGFIPLAVLPELPAQPTTEQIRAYQEANAQLGLYLAPLSILFGFVIVPITNAAVIDAVSRCYLSREATIGTSYSHAKRILLPLLGTWLLQMLAIMGGFILLIIPGIIFTFWFYLATHTVVIGGESGKAALSRSKKLMKGNMGTAVALTMVISVIQWAFIGGAYFIPQKHVATAAQAVLGAAAFVFATVAIVVFYYSCRCKVENFDLALLAENIGLEGPVETENAL